MDGAWAAGKTRAPGSDADLVVSGPAGAAVLGDAAFADGDGPSVYAGM